MIPSAFASAAAVGDERLWRTNPHQRLIDTCSATDVDWIGVPDRLSRLIESLSLNGICLPPEALGRWADAGLLDSVVVPTAKLSIHPQGSSG